MKRDPNCTRCPLHETAEFVCLLGQGPEPCQAMIVGEAPGEREDDSGKPFVGRAGRLLDEVMEDAGLDRHKVFITNAVACRPPNNRTPRKREIEACKHWLQKQIKVVEPKVILALGNVAMQSLLGIKGIRKHRGRPIEHEGHVILPTYHPSYILRGDGRERGVLEQDMHTFKSIIDFGGIPEEREVNVTIVNSAETFDQMLDALTGVVSCDIETTCLYPWDKNARIVTLGFGTRDGEFSIPLHHKESPWDRKDVEEMIERITEKLEDCLIVFQGGKFDIVWVKKHLGVLWQNDFDIMLAHHILDENSPHDIEYIAKALFGAHPWDIPLEEKQGNAPFSRIAKYHGHDLYWTRRAYFKLRAQLKAEPKVERLFYKLVMPVANVFIRIESHGCYIDTKKMAKVEKYLNKKIADAEGKLKKWGDINWASPKQVGQLLYGELGITCPLKTKKGADSTAESALKQIEHPVVTDLLTLRGARQQRSFFIEGWKPFIVNNRIHPSFKLHGTVTGRPSCEHPNFQQVPRDPLIRSLITAPPGWTLLDGDLSQIELRIVAELSRVPAMVHAYMTGLDIHWNTALNEIERAASHRDIVLHTAGVKNYAEAIDILRKMGPDAAAEIDPAWKEIRKKAKAINFGYVYGMWWKKFKIYARDNYDIIVTDEEAQESRISFFSAYPLKLWHQKQSNRAREHGFVESLVGRKRRLPDAMSHEDSYERAEAWRQAINSPVQGLASDLNLMVLLQMATEFPHTFYRPVCTVHDSILAEVRNDHVPQVVSRMEEIMKGPDLLKLFNVRFSIPLAGETKLGAWGTGVSLERWKPTC